MSVILKRNNKIILYCKGADNVIYERLGSNQNDIKLRTQEHLNVRLNRFEDFDFLTRNFHRNLPVKAFELWF
jgi:magnesium-transporting ATPase (P-type)